MNAIVRSFFLLALQSLSSVTLALQPTTRSTLRGVCALTTLPSSTAQNASPPPKRSPLCATLPAACDSAEALFPSDDSDYELTAESHTKKSALVKNKTRKGSNNEKDDSHISVNDHPLQSQILLQFGDNFAIADPIDIIANWISDRIVEQSLQRKRPMDNEKNDSNCNNQAIDGASSSNYVMESYSPGSALDVIAQASSTYTPLSYQIRTVVRTVLPSILVAFLAWAVYPSTVHWISQLHTGASASLTVGKSVDDSLLYTDQVLTVLSNDLSQYVQNILTTCALLFGMLVGQTYYFMYQQQELVFYALFAEVTEAKSLLEQISLMTYGRPKVYNSLLSRMDDYVQNDLKLLSVKDPIAVTSRLPKDDPLESILYATSVGLPGVVYETVKSLRQARATRCGALQRKLPVLHVYCLRLLGVIVMTTFPVCGTGSQAIAPNVLVLQSYLFGILAFALTLVLNVVEELRNSRTKMGAYNVDGILEVMVGGLELELEERLEGNFWGVGISPGLPTRGAFKGEGGMGVGSCEGNLWAVENEETVTGFWEESIEDVQSVVGKEKGTSKPSPLRRRVKKWLKNRLLRK